jgi:hypothetical protein
MYSCDMQQPKFYQYILDFLLTLFECNWYDTKVIIAFKITLIYTISYWKLPVGKKNNLISTKDKALC